MKLLIFSLLLFPCIAQATIWHVGPTQTYNYCSQVAPMVQNGDTVQIDNATYINDAQVQWSQNNLLIEGINGRPRLQAGSTIANDPNNGKGIFVISGQQVKVSNIEFANATVMDHNGAGIRQEGANLYVTQCKFVNNEMGILTGAIANCKTTVEFCEFLNNGSAANPGYQHNIYIGHIDTFLCRYNYSHDATAEGHELKSRANYNFILYNRIANENSVDSRTIDLPNGGTSVLVGNIIEQSINSANSNILGYGLEGFSNTAPHNLWLANNTFINKHTNGSFVHIASGTNTLFIKNNIFAGPKTAGLIVGNATTIDSSNNKINDAISAYNFTNTTNYNYHLNATSVAINTGTLLSNNINGYSLNATMMYKDTCDFENRIVNGTIDVGAFEWNTPTLLNYHTLNPMAIYPNPSHGFLIIKNAYYHPFKKEIFDISGQLLFSTMENKVDMGSLAKGVYLLKCNGYSEKVILD